MKNEPRSGDLLIKSWEHLVDTGVIKMSDQPKMAQGIMQTAKYEDGSATYRLSCSCQAPEDDVSVMIDVEAFDDIGEVTIRFNTKLHIPIWRQGFCRFCTALKLLFTGEAEYESETLLTAEQALAFADTLKSKITELQVKQKKAKALAAKSKKAKKVLEQPISVT